MTEREKMLRRLSSVEFAAHELHIYLDTHPNDKAAGAALAVYNEETGAVEWNMGSTFMPEAGVTYQVRFKV